MAIKYKVTLQSIPQADDTPFNGQNILEDDITRPSGAGWKLEYSFKGNYYIYHIWKRGDVGYDSGMENIFTAKDDDVENSIRGQGNELKLNFSSSDSSKSLDAKFINDHSYIYGGRIIWNSTDMNNKITISMVASATKVTTDSENGNVIVQDNKIIPDDSNGDHIISSTPTVVLNTNNEGYWDIVNYEVVPNTDQKGQYDLYDIEKVTSTLLNSIPADGIIQMAEIKTSNAYRVSPGYKMRIEGLNNAGQEWDCYVTLYMIREANIN